MLNYQRVHLVHAFSLPRHSLRLKRVQCSLAWVDLGAWAWFVGKSSIKIWALHQTIEKKHAEKGVLTNEPWWYYHQKSGFHQWKSKKQKHTLTISNLNAAIKATTDGNVTTEKVERYWIYDCMIFIIRVCSIISLGKVWELWWRTVYSWMKEQKSTKISEWLGGTLYRLMTRKNMAKYMMFSTAKVGFRPRCGFRTWSRQTISGNGHAPMTYHDKNNPIWQPCILVLRRIVLFSHGMISNAVVSWRPSGNLL
jgi:hypothetical protein